MEKKSKESCSQSSNNMKAREILNLFSQQLRNKEVFSYEDFFDKNATNDDEMVDISR
jgi:hypothetical protein